MATQSITAIPNPARIREDRTIFRALRILESRAVTAGPLLSDTVTCSKFFRLRLAGEEREHFEVAFLDAKNKLIAAERLFSGTVDSSEVYPRIVLQRALRLNAAALIVAHNHPSGDPEPSKGDIAMTHRLRDVLALVEVRLLDHFVVGRDRVVSMHQKGLFK